MKKNRCPWCEAQTDYKHYHDTEWGVPIYEDQKLFEAFVLETFQAGLRWLTILRKRENFRKAFDRFDPYQVARYDKQKIDDLCTNQGIIRNRLKIKAAINNAQRFLDLQESQLGFSQWLWSFVDHQPIQNTYRSIDQVPATTALSDWMSIALKKKGFKFVGSKIVYSHMQAIGMVNDHLVSCYRYEEVKKLGQIGQKFRSGN